MTTTADRVPELIEALKRIHRRVIRLPLPAGTPLEGLFTVDLSHWKLALSERTPFISVSAHAAADVGPETLASTVWERVKKSTPEARDCVVLTDDGGAGLRNYTSPYSDPQIFVLNAAEQRRILAAPAVDMALLEIIRQQMPLTRLSPYQYSGAVSGSRFFDRQTETERVLRHSSNYAITGIRRIGKTSLMKEINRRLSDETVSKTHTLWLDCSILGTPMEFITAVVQALHPQELKRLDRVGAFGLSLVDFFRRMKKKYDGPVVLLLDEVDRMLEYPRDRHDIVSELRAATHAGYCRLIIAGFQTLKTAMSNSESPYYHFFEEISLRPFTRRDTRDMVVGPMQHLGVTLHDAEEIVSRIYDDTRGHPLLIQFCCAQLLDELDRKDVREFSVKDINELYQTQAYKEKVLNVFRDNVKPAAKMIVYALLLEFPHQSSFSRSEISAALARQQLPMPDDDVDRLCDELVNAAQFDREGLRYTFTVPLLPKLLPMYDNLKELIGNYRREVSSDPHRYVH